MEGDGSILTSRAMAPDVGDVDTAHTQPDVSSSRHNDPDANEQDAFSTRSALAQSGSFSSRNEPLGVRGAENPSADSEAQDNSEDMKPTENVDRDLFPDQSPVAFAIGGEEARSKHRQMDSPTLFQDQPANGSAEVGAQRLETIGMESGWSSDMLAHTFPEESGPSAQGMPEAQSRPNEEQQAQMDVSAHQDEDPFRFLGENARSNSFPDIPPSQPIDNEGNSFMGSQQVGMEDVDMFQVEAADTHHGFTVERGNGLPDTFGMTEAEGQVEGSSFFDRQIGDKADGTNPTDAEARYEEGLPLIHSEDVPQEPSQPLQNAGEHQSSMSRLPSIDEVPGNQPLAAGPPQPAQDVGSAPQFPPPQRKSTEQILGSIDMSSQADASDDLGLSQLSIKDDAAEAVNGVPVAGGDGMAEEADLTAMWQAALGDDELLEDANETSDTTWFPEDAQGQATESAWDISGTADQQPSSDYFSTETNQTTMDSTRMGVPNANISPAMPSRDFNQASNVAQSWQPSHAGVGGSGRTDVQGGGSIMSGRVASSSHQQSQTYSPLWNVQQQPAQRPEVSKAQSFVDKSKGGYSSPYDLPSDLTKPRKRGSVQHAPPGRYGYGPSPSAPPRSSSVSASQPVQGPTQPNGQLPGPRPGPTASATAGYPPASHPQLGRNATMPNASAAKSSTNITTFFEDLPVHAGPKRSHQTGRAPRTSGEFASSSPPPPPQTMSQPQMRPQEAFMGPAQRSPSTSPALVTAEQLRPPERLDPFATSSRPSSASKPPAASTSRYSPAPPSQPPSQGRAKYAPIPGSTPPVGLPHQPRTSSPLASKSTPLKDQSSSVPGPPGYSKYTPQHQPSQDTAAHGPLPTAPPSYGDLPRPVEQHMSAQHSQPRSQDSYGPLLAESLQQPVMDDSNRGFAPGSADHIQDLSAVPPAVAQQSALKPLPNAYHSPPAQYDTLPGAVASPPRRPQTQSPGTAYAGPPRTLLQQLPVSRPASVDVPTSPRLTNAHPAIAAGISTRPRGISQQRDYIAPTDGRELDPLSRWRGCPIFTWGFGGIVVTSFPKEVPRYSPGQRYPSLKCSPGEVRTRPIKGILPLEEHAAGFPGPLRGKVKKKDIIAWLSSRIGQLDAQIRDRAPLASPEELKRYDERILLLKLLCVLVDNDGSSNGSPKAEQAVREVLISHQPGLTVNAPSNQGLTALPLPVPERQSPQITSSHDLNPAAVDTIKKLLLNGEREKAVWHAVDNRMWAHAMLISSAVTPAIWKQVVREFVRHAVRRDSRDSESLAAVYQIFAGNIDEFIDELVPSSARAGLQFISTSADTMPSKTGLEGLDKWIETLTLVLSNRSAEDVWALKQLGQLLLFYGRVEAAHICFLFAGPCAPFGSADDPQTAMTLVGQNHLQEPSQANILDSTLLSEVYEFALLLANPSAVNSAPHLQAYKFYHTLILAQHGHLHEAQQYCESISQGIKSAGKVPSPYYRALAPELDDLSRRLQRSLKDESSSWISKPSIEKVSDSLFARFNNFVAGSENDKGKAGAGNDDAGAEVGPFARIAGNTPVISRPSSQNDVHPRSLPQDGLLSAAPRSHSGVSNRQARYTPVGAYVPQAQGSDSNLAASASNWDANSTSYPSPHLPLPHSSDTLGVTQQNRLANSEPSLKYKPFGGPTPNMLQPQEGSSMLDPNGYLSDGRPSTSPAEPPRSSFLDNSVEQSSTLNSDYTPMASGYQPPSYEPSSEQGQGYEPPSYTFDDTTGQNGTASPEEKPKKKSAFMDDDDDEIMTRAAELARKEKERKDKEAEENFKKAAEADAKRGQQQGDKKGWFGGWFGKKEQAQGPGPIKAKLGEESSFYYDTELKKWVNKKGGAPQPSAAGTPPPPKGPPSRAVSGAMAAPSRSISASAPPPASAGTPPPPTSSSYTNPTGPPSINHTPPTSRPPPPGQSSSGMAVPARGSSPSVPPSNHASGPVGAGGSSSAPSVPEAGATPSPSTMPQSQAPPSRPATAMSNASSIDDLLGPVGTARKGGTMKKAKKGRGYVDVMASSAGSSGAASAGGAGGSSAGGGLPT